MGQFWPFLVLLALAPLVLVAARWVSNAPRRALHARHRDLLAGGRLFEAAHLAANDFDAPVPNPLQRASRGFVVIGTDEVRFVGLRASTRQPVVTRFDRARHRVALFRRRSLAIGLPTLIRIGDGDDPHFLFVDGGPGGGADHGATESLFEALRTVLPAGRTEPEHAALPPSVSALIAVLPLLGLCAIAAWAAYAGSSTHGPRFVATGEGSVVVVRADDVIRFDADGREAARFTLDALGLEGVVTGVHVTGAAEALLGETGTGALQRCDLARGRCEREPASLPKFEGPFAFVPTDDGVVAVDTLSHRAWRGTVALPGEGHRLCAPRAVARARDGRIVFADTGQYRVLAWDPSTTAATVHATSRPHEPLRCTPRADRRVAIDPLPLARRGGVAPTALAQAADGRWWVVANTRRLREGDVLVLDASFAPVAAIELPPHADPASVAALGDTMLVADPRRQAVYRFDREGGRLPDFADAVFGRERQPGARMLGLALRLGTPALGALLAVIVVLFVVGARARKRRLREIFVA